MATLEALITIQETQRLLFRRMINAEINPEVCMKIMAFWMWLESQGFQQLVTKVSSRDDKFLTYVCNEAEAVLASLKPNSKTPTSPNLMPMTSNLTQCFFSIEDLFVDKEAILQGTEDLFDKCCRMLFEDILEEKGIKVGSDKEGNGAAIAKAITRWIRPNREGPSEQGKGHGSDVLLGSPPNGVGKLGLPSSSSGGDGEGAQPTASKLDPFAREWNPVTERAPEEDRCLFLTFSNGYPLHEHQIASFFTRKYGPCVERVYVHWPESRRVPPLFGKVVFNTSYIPVMVLSGQKRIKFIIDGRPLWCKKFEPKKKSGHGREN